MSLRAALLLPFLSACPGPGPDTGVEDTGEADTADTADTDTAETGDTADTDTGTVDAPAIYGDGRIPAVAFDGSAYTLMLIEPSTGSAETVATASAAGSPQAFYAAPRFLHDGRLVTLAAVGSDIVVYAVEPGGVLAPLYTGVQADKNSAVGLDAPNDDYVAFHDYAAFSYGTVVAYHVPTDAAMDMTGGVGGDWVAAGPGGVLAWWGTDRDIHVGDPSTDASAALGLAGVSPGDLAVLPDGTIAFTDSARAGKIFLVDPADAAAVTEVPNVADARTYGLFALPDGRLAYTADDRGQVDVWVTDVAGNATRVTNTTDVNEKLRNVWF